MSPAAGPARNFRPAAAAEPRPELVRAARPEIWGDPELAAILRRCATGDPEGVAALQAWQGGRLAAALARLLGDPALAARHLEGVLTALADNAAGFDATRDSAEDWAFARLRLQARHLPRRSTAERPPVGPVAAAVPEAPSEPTGLATCPGSPAPADVPLRTVLPQRRAIQRPAKSGRRRRLSRRRLAWGLLAVVIALVAALVLPQLPTRRATPPPAAGIAVLTAPEPPPTLPPAGPGTTAAGAALTAKPPTEGMATPQAPPPAVAPLPHPRPVAAPAIASPPPPAATGGIRVFLHHFTADEAGAAIALRLAERLRGQDIEVAAIRRIPFGIPAASVRYFYPADRSAAQRLVGVAGPVLAIGGRAPPRLPGDFTHYQPKPRPGTVEVWIPSR